MGNPTPSYDIQLEELRGRVAGVEGDLKGHEDLCLFRYNQIVAGQIASAAGTAELKADIKDMHSSLLKYFLIAVTILAGFSTWALNTLWTMQQETNRSLIQMTVGAPAGGTTLPYLPARTAPEKPPH